MADSFIKELTDKVAKHLQKGAIPEMEEFVDHVNEMKIISERNVAHLTTVQTNNEAMGIPVSHRFLTHLRINQRLLNYDQEFISNHEERMKEARRLQTGTEVAQAFVSGLHPRLGADSHVYSLDQNLVKKILHAWID